MGKLGRAAEESGLLKKKYLLKKVNGKEVRVFVLSTPNQPTITHERFGCSDSLEKQMEIAGFTITKG